MDVVCIKNCESVEENFVHEYFIGKTYRFNLSSYNRTYLFLVEKPILMCMGNVEYDFIEENFIPKDDFDEILYDVDKLYDKCFKRWI